MNKETIDMLVNAALEARKASYCPYSSFAVGAALLTEAGKIFTGANIECSAHTPTVCAERVAFFRAIHEGERHFSAIAVVGGVKDEAVSSLCPPCGTCRQVMAEFCGDDLSVILFDGESAEVHTLGELLPLRFGL